MDCYSCQKTSAVGFFWLVVMLGTPVRSNPTLSAPSLRFRTGPVWVLSGCTRSAQVTALTRFLVLCLAGRSGSGDPRRSQAVPVLGLSASLSGAVRPICRRCCAGSGGTRVVGGRPGRSSDPGAHALGSGCGGRSLEAEWLVLPQGGPGRETLAHVLRSAGGGLLVRLGWLSLQGTG